MTFDDDLSSRLASPPCARWNELSLLPTAGDSGLRSSAVIGPGAVLCGDRTVDAPARRRCWRVIVTHSLRCCARAYWRRPWQQMSGAGSADGGAKARPFGRASRPFRHQSQQLVSGRWPGDAGAPKVRSSTTARRRFNPKETDHERYEPKSLPLRYLLWRCLRLRLPEARRTAVLRLRHAVPVRCCLRLPQELSRAAPALPRHRREPAASNATNQCTPSAASRI